MRMAMTLEHKEIVHLCNLHGCVDERELSSSPSFSVEDKTYFHLCANKCLAFWSFVVASFSSIIAKTRYFFCGCITKPAEKVSVSLSNRNITNASNNIKCDRYSEISDFERESYLDSLISLEEEDSEWLLDPKPYGCSYEEDPSDLSTHKPSYWDSLLWLEGKDSEWLLDSKQELEDGFPRTYKGSWGSEFLPSLQNDDHAEEFSDNEPLFWPFEEKFNWNSEDPCSLFSTSPISTTTSSVKECKQKGYEAGCCVNSETSRLSMLSKSSALECKDEKVVLQRGEDLSNKMLSFSNTFLNNEDFDSNKGLLLGKEYYFGLDQVLLPIETLVGLNEFDGHEGLDSEFNGDESWSWMKLLLHA